MIVVLGMSMCHIQRVVQGQVFNLMALASVPYDRISPVHIPPLLSGAALTLHPPSNAYHDHHFHSAPSSAIFTHPFKDIIFTQPWQRLNFQYFKPPSKPRLLLSPCSANIVFTQPLYQTAMIFTRPLPQQLWFSLGPCFNAYDFHSVPLLLNMILHCPFFNGHDFHSGSTPLLYVWEFSGKVWSS